MSSNSRINAPAIIKAADDADCDVGVILYEEGKRTSKIGVYCDGGIKLPVPEVSK